MHRCKESWDERMIGARRGCPAAAACLLQNSRAAAGRCPPSSGSPSPVMSALAVELISLPCSVSPGLSDLQEHMLDVHLSGSQLGR